MVDYCMGSTLWQHREPGESIATIHIAMTYLQSARVGEIECHSVLDRRNRTTAALRSEVLHEDGRLLGTAQGTFAIFPAAKAAKAAKAAGRTGRR
jgi:acyl-coenzyme A thioesterase PaaI-like protein